MAAQAQVQRQIDAARAAIIRSVPANRQAQLLAQLEVARAAANAQIARALARCS